MTTSNPISFRDLCRRYGIETQAMLAEKLRMSPQQAWNLWHGYAIAGATMALRLEDLCGIPWRETMAAIPDPDYGAKKRVVSHAS